MVIDSETNQQLYSSRQDLIQQLTELNARDIRSQVQLAGTEMHLERCREAIEGTAQSEEVAAEMARYEREIGEIERARVSIYQERDALTEKLHEVDTEIQNGI